MAQAVVIDNGTGFTKLGYAGNIEPSFCFPTCYGSRAVGAKGGDLADLDFLIGAECEAQKLTYPPTYPIRHGLIDNWDAMEKIWQHCIFKYLKATPEDTYFLLTEPPLNPPENRESTAEIMFETFGAKGLYIGVQAALALYGSGGSQTGTVVDSGDGVTHVIPVAHGYVITSGIKHIPLAGRDISEFVKRLILERGAPDVPREHLNSIAQEVKESYCWLSRDLAQEFATFDANPSAAVKTFSFTDPKTQKVIPLEIGHEQFLAPEVFFNPAIYSSSFTTPLPEVVNESILSAPLDVQRGLYSNIVLSGGSTMFTNFVPRLKRAVASIVTARLDAITARLAPGSEPPAKMEVNVVKAPMQRNLVWHGGSRLASSPGFAEGCISKAMYDEHGPSICRYSQAFQGTG